MITADVVKKLRDMTGAGMMDCKRALTEANGDMEKAIDVLRKSGAAKAEKKSGRATKEGKIACFVDGNVAAMVEVLCETDFVAKTDKFNAYIDELLKRIAAGEGNGCVSEAVQAAEKEAMVALIATIGENMQIRRAARWAADGKLASYIHMQGRIGVLVEVEGADDAELLKNVCMHIAAFNPAFIDRSEVPAEWIAREKEIAAAQLAGKPAEMIEKIVMGKINKRYTEVCLMDQPWIMDDKASLAKLYKDLKVKRFVRWEIGEEL